MNAIWTFHRFERSESRWIDIPDVEADATAGVLAPIRPEVEATLSLDNALVIRDTVWPLAWRLCLEPIRSLLADGQPEWLYRCVESPNTYTLRTQGDTVHIRKNQDAESEFPAREFWPALIAAGVRVIALAERGRGSTDRDVALLQPSRTQAEAILRERGWAP